MIPCTSRVRLGDVLAKSEESVEIRPGDTYREVTVRLWGRGVTLRREVCGAEIAASRRSVVRSGQFILSRIDARNGAFGLVPVELDGAVVSTDFPAFAVQPDRLLPEFLNWMSKTADFTDLCRAASEGTTNRVRLKEDRFLRMTVSLPPLPEQQRIVARLDALAAKIAEARGVAAASRQVVAATPYAEATRLFSRMTSFNAVPIARLGEGGNNPIQIGPFGAQLHRSEFAAEGIPVLNVGNVWPEGLLLERYDHVSTQKAAALARYRIAADDLLFARSGATLGKVCLVPTGCDGWLMTGHLFRVRFDKSKCLPAFALAGLRWAEPVRGQVFKQVRGATRPGFNTTLLSRVEVPLPPLPEQRRIVEYLEGLQARVHELKARQVETAAELDALLPAILDRAFKGEL